MKTVKKGCREKYLLTDGTTGKAGGTQSMEGFGCQVWKFIQRETSLSQSIFIWAKLCFSRMTKTGRGGWSQASKLGNYWENTDESKNQGPEGGMMEEWWDLKRTDRSCDKWGILMTGLKVMLFKIKGRDARCWAFRCTDFLRYQKDTLGKVWAEGSGEESSGVIQVDRELEGN